MHPVAQDWDFYPLLVDSEAASIYLDLGLARTAPARDQPRMIYVRVVMRQPRPDGLSSSGEVEALSILEDALLDSVAQDGTTTYAGRNTSGGNRDFYFYTADAGVFAERAEDVMRKFPDYQFETGGRLDPEWQVYFEFLYPPADDLQRILNRRVIDSLEAHGDISSKARPIDHVAYLPDARAVANLGSYLNNQGFINDEPKIEDGMIVLRFQRSDRPDAMDQVVLPIARRVHELGGDYDGWGCEVVH
jgi:hypothetical protein